MFCSNCGKKVPVDTKFCPYCGADLRSEATPAPSNQQVQTPVQPAPAQAKRSTVNGIVSWYHQLQRPWLVWLVAVLIIVAGGAGYYHSQSMRVQAVKDNPWYLITKNDLNGSEGAGKLIFNKDGRIQLNTDSDASSFSDSLTDTVENAGSWHGDHNKLVVNVSESGSDDHYKMTMTKIKRVKESISGNTYQGYLVEVDVNMSGQRDSTNMYLLHR